MTTPPKYEKGRVLARYPLGQLMQYTPPETDEVQFAKILQPPATLPEELCEDLLSTMREETESLREPPGEMISPSLLTEIYPGCLVALYSQPDFPSLSHYMKENAPLPLERVMGFLDQLAEIFNLLFHCGIHRFQLELNIMPVDPEEHIIYYLDTGLVNLAKYPELLRLGYIDGPPQFIPPELLRAGELQATAEVYLFAVFTHYLLTGEIPHARHPLATSAAFCISEHLPPLRRFNDEREKKLNDILARASHKDPKSRYPTLEEFLQNIREILR